MRIEMALKSARARVECVCKAEENEKLIYGFFTLHFMCDLVDRRAAKHFSLSRRQNRETNDLNL